MSIPADKMKTFLEVAGAIRTIRDQRLYREEFESFEAYCLARLGLSEEVVSRLLAEAALEDRLSQGSPENQ